ncbi:MAG: ATP-binding cassette domain-containing protein [Alphaproteobacteria bacterium]|nr:ATP-binding cassette domain-containing protein [Alphaproteobacteria bacterium]
MTSSVPLLQLNDIKVHFAVRGEARRQGLSVKAVDGVSCQLQPGETLGVVGESGCGKSTLARTLLKLVPLTAGQILWQGKNIDTFSAREMQALRRDVRMIFQDPYASLNPRMTVGEQIGEPLVLFHPEQSAGIRQQQVAEMMQRVGLRPDLANRYPHEFSGGQCQRANIARALVGQPKLLICDESVSALDVSIQAQVINLIDDLQKADGISIVFIAHDLSVVQHISDRVAVMYLGKIMEIAKTEDLFSAPHHPYTTALLSAVPQPDPRSERSRERIILKGDLPSPINPPAGCVFNTRCWKAQDICRTKIPELLTVGKSQVACHFPE